MVVKNVKSDLNFYLQESKEARKGKTQMQNQQNGMLPIYLGDTPVATSAAALQETKRDLSWTGNEKGAERKKHTLKGVSTTVKLVARLSPKSMRRKTEQKTALVKVILFLCLNMMIPSLTEVISGTSLHR
jgi:hypothetical protein